MPPTALILAFAILLGYPLVQIAAILARRPMRLRFNALIAEMLADPAYQSPAEKQALATLAVTSRGRQLSIALAPVMIPALLASVILGWQHFARMTKQEAERSMALSFKHFAEIPDSSSIWSDERLVRALDLAIPLELAAWPISTFVGVLLSIPVAIVATVVAWINQRAVEFLSPREVIVRLARTFQALVSA